VLKRIGIPIAILISVILIGCVSFYHIEGVDLVESVYWTISTVTTVGYGDITPKTEGGKIFSIFLMISGVGAILYVLMMMAEFIIEGEMREMITMTRKEREVRKMKNHVIVCGYGRVGRNTAKELISKKEDIVIIDIDEDVFKRDEPDAPYIIGDARKEEILERANIKTAKGLISALHNNPDNLLVILASKELNPEIKLSSRASDVDGMKYLRRAGVENIVLPERLGGMRLARSFIKPEVCDFVDLALMGEEVEIEAIMVSSGSKIDGKTIKKSGVREDTGAIIVALKRKEKVITNPDPDQRIVSGDVLIVIVSKDKADELKVLTTHS
jgi:voltage-gated potassium channel